ncbi:MAG: hypothetical protein JNM27_17605 [Leptospirales bacterium]|nr:hypothetical protein [Leptospirales bacterium]
MKTKDISLSVWRELTVKKEEFCKIVRLLVEFDEKTGRYLKYNDPETHFMRKAVSVADTSRIRIFLRDLGGYVYSVVAELRSLAGTTATAWIHEDGICKEREEAETNHPVHSIVCVTDLYLLARECFPEETGVSPVTLDLIVERES